MSTPELLKDLLVAILSIQKELNGSDEEKIKAAQKDYRELQTLSTKNIRI